MNAAQWRQYDKPISMLRVLGEKVTERKLRLFAVACCRRIAHLLPAPRWHEVLDLAEKAADGLLDDIERRKVCRESRYTMPYPPNLAALAACLTLADRRWLMESLERGYTASAAEAEYMEARRRGSVPGLCNFRGVRGKEAMLVREIFGNPFRPLALDPSWTAWNDGCVVKVAQAIYEERRFNEMPILADALMDAGCYHDDILAHCCTRKPHVRGCWLVDLILSKDR